MEVKVVIGKDSYPLQATETKNYLKFEATPDQPFRGSLYMPKVPVSAAQPAKG